MWAPIGGRLGAGAASSAFLAVRRVGTRGERGEINTGRAGPFLVYARFRFVCRSLSTSGKLRRLR
jgi:hypothetical protein